MQALTAKLLIWRTILWISIEERLVYRVDFALATLMRFVPIITQIFFWFAVYAASDRDDIAGFKQGDMIAYYLLVMVSRALSSMPNLASGIALQIRDGEIKKFLIQPVDLIGFLLLQRMAHKLVYYGVAAIPFALVFFLCRHFFPGWPPPLIVYAYLASLLMAFLMGYFFEAMIGMIGFWFLEVSSLLFIYMLLHYMLSGHMFPLAMLPSNIEPAVRFLPFHYMAGFPAEVFLGKISSTALARGLTIQLVWVVFFIAASRVVYHYGLKRYSGYGG